MCFLIYKLETTKQTSQQNPNLLVSLSELNDNTGDLICCVICGSKEVEVVVGDQVGISFESNVSFDMEWQWRSTGHTYNSRSGHAFLIGMETKKVVSMVIYCKHCKKCNSHARKIKEGKAATTSHPPSHRCPKNYADKSSKSMKADAAVEMCVKLVRQYKFNVYVDTFVSDDNATTRKI